MSLKNASKQANRLIAILLSVCLLWTSGGVAEAALDISHPPVRSFEEVFTPPTALGHIVDSFTYSAKDPRKIILIQDLHAHYGVQKNIAGILDFLERRMTRSLDDSITSHLVTQSTSHLPFALAVEGASGPIDLTVMAHFPDAQIKQAAADYLMREGELTGAEDFAILHGRPQALTGVEDPHFYTLHRDLFRKTLADRERLVKSLKQIQADIQPLRKTVYSRPVKAIQGLVDAFDKGQLATEDYAAQLASLAGTFNLPLEAGYPFLARFLKNPAGGYAAQLEEVLHEASELAYRLKLAHAQKGPEKDLVMVEHDLALLLRVADLQATELEVRDFGPRLNQFVALAGTLLRNGMTRSLDDSMTSHPVIQSSSHQPFDATALRRLISSSIDYYVMALMRNNPMVENTLSLLNAPHAPETAVLITGGFHTTPITQILRQKNISYLVITPSVDQFTAADHALYVKRLDGQLLTEQDLLAAGRDQNSTLVRSLDKGSALAKQFWPFHRKRDVLSPGVNIITTGVFLATAFVIGAHLKGLSYADYLHPFKDLIAPLAYQSDDVLKWIAGSTLLVATTILGRSPQGSVPRPINLVDAAKSLLTLIRAAQKQGHMHVFMDDWNSKASYLQEDALKDLAIRFIQMGHTQHADEVHLDTFDSAAAIEIVLSSELELQDGIPFKDEASIKEWHAIQDLARKYGATLEIREREDLPGTAIMLELPFIHPGTGERLAETAEEDVQDPRSWITSTLQRAGHTLSAWELLDAIARNLDLSKTPAYSPVDILTHATPVQNLPRQLAAGHLMSEADLIAAGESVTTGDIDGTTFRTLEEKRKLKRYAGKKTQLDPEVYFLIGHFDERYTEHATQTGFILRTDHVFPDGADELKEGHEISTLGSVSLGRALILVDTHQRPAVAEALAKHLREKNPMGDPDSLNAQAEQLMTQALSLDSKHSLNNLVDRLLNTPEGRILLDYYFQKPAPPAKPGPESQGHSVDNAIKEAAKTAIDQIKPGMSREQINDLIKKDLRLKGIELREGFGRVASQGSDVITDILSMIELYMRSNGRPGTNAHEWMHVLQVDALLKAGLPTSLIETRAYRTVFELPAYRFGFQVALQTQDWNGLLSNGLGWFLYRIGIGPLATDLSILVEPFAQGVQRFHNDESAGLRIPGLSFGPLKNEAGAMWLQEVAENVLGSASAAVGLNADVFAQVKKFIGTLVASVHDPDFPHQFDAKIEDLLAGKLDFIDVQTLLDLDKLKAPEGFQKRAGEPDFIFVGNHFEHSTAWDQLLQTQDHPAAMGLILHTQDLGTIVLIPKASWERLDPEHQDFIREHETLETLHRSHAEAVRLQTPERYNRMVAEIRQRLQTAVPPKATSPSPYGPGVKEITDTNDLVTALAAMPGASIPVFSRIYRKHGHAPDITELSRDKVIALIAMGKVKVFSVDDFEHHPEFVLTPDAPLDQPPLAAPTNGSAAPSFWNIHLKTRNASSVMPAAEEAQILDQANRVMRQLSPDALAKALQKMKGRSNLSEKDFTGQMNIEYHDKGSHKYVFKVTIYERNGQNNQFLLAYKTAKDSRDPITATEIEDLKKLKGRHVPAFGLVIPMEDGSPAFLEEFIEGTKASDLAHEKKLTRDMRKSIVKGLLSITVLLKGRAPRDAHAENFIMRKGSNEAVMVDLGVRRLRVLGSNAEPSSQITFLTSLVAHYGELDQPQGSHYIFDAVIEEFGQDIGRRFLEDVYKNAMVKGPDGLGKYLYKRGETLFWVLELGPGPKMSLDQFSALFLNELGAYLNNDTASTLPHITSTPRTEQPSPAPLAQGVDQSQALNNQRYADPSRGSTALLVLFTVLTVGATIMGASARMPLLATTVVYASNRMFWNARPNFNQFSYQDQEAFVEGSRRLSVINLMMGAGVLFGGISSLSSAPLLKSFGFQGLLAWYFALFALLEITHHFVYKLSLGSRNTDLRQNLRNWLQGDPVDWRKPFKGGIGQQIDKMETRLHTPSPTPSAAGFGRGIIRPLKFILMPLLRQFNVSESFYDDILGPVIEELLFTALPIALHATVPALFLVRAVFIALHLFASQAPPGTAPRTWYEKITIPVLASITPILFTYLSGPWIVYRTTKAVVTAISALGHIDLNLAVPDINRLTGKNFQKARLEFPERKSKSVWDREDIQTGDFEYLGPVSSKNISTHTPHRIRDKTTGEVLLLKRAPEHSIRAELIGQRIFQEVGLPVPKMRMITANGEPQLVIELLDGYSETAGNQLPQGFEHNPVLQSAILLDLLIYNYDRVPWNMMYKGTDVAFIDFGASIMSRAKGELKGFPGEITSHHQLDTISKNPQYAGTPVNQAYANALQAHGSGLRTSLDLLSSLSNEAIDRIIDEAYAGLSVADMRNTIYQRLQLLGNESSQYAPASATFELILGQWNGDERNYLKYILKLRRNNIQKYFGDILGSVNPQKLLPPAPPATGLKLLTSKDEPIADFKLQKNIQSPEFSHLSTNRARPPRNGMDVTNAYLQNMNIEPEMMSEGDITAALSGEVLRLAQRHPGQTVRLFLDEQMRKIEKFRKSKSYRQLLVVARIMAAVVGQIQKENPHRFIVHFARDMGFTLTTQHTLNTLRTDPAQNPGGALYLNRAMMGPYYTELHDTLAVATAQGRDLPQTAEDWFASRINSKDRIDFQELVRVTRDSLQRMGAYDNSEVTLFDTGLVGTMPWFTYALMRHDDRPSGNTRDIQVLLVHSTNSTRKISEEDLGTAARGQLAEDVWQMLENSDGMLSILEGLGDQQAHPVLFDSLNQQIVPESPEHQLQFFFARLLFQNMATAEYLAASGLEELLDQPGVTLPEIPTFDFAPASQGSPLRKINPEHLAAFAKKIQTVDHYLLQQNYLVKDYKVDPKIWTFIKPNEFYSTPAFDWPQYLAEIAKKKSTYFDPAAYKIKPFDWAKQKQVKSNNIDPKVYEIKPLDFAKQKQEWLDQLTKLDAMIQWMQNPQQDSKQIINLSKIQSLQHIVSQKYAPMIIQWLKHTFSYPKRTPYGLTGWITTAASLAAATVLRLFDIVPVEQAMGLAVAGVLAGMLLWKSALSYRDYLARIHSADPKVLEEGLAQTAPNLLVGRIQNTIEREFGTQRAAGIKSTGIVDEFVDMDETQFNQQFPWESAQNQFRRGSFYNPGDNRVYVNNHGKPGRYVNNALYEAFGQTLYVSVNAARSNSRALGLVLAHEMGKRDFFAFPLSWSIPEMIRPFIAELYANAYELFYFFKVPFSINPQNPNSGAKFLSKGFNLLAKLTAVLIALSVPYLSDTLAHANNLPPSVSPFLSPLWLLLLLFGLSPKFIFKTDKQTANTQQGLPLTSALHPADEDPVRAAVRAGRTGGTFDIHATQIISFMTGGASILIGALFQSLPVVALGGAIMTISALLMIGHAIYEWTSPSWNRWASILLQPTDIFSDMALWVSKNVISIFNTLTPAFQMMLQNPHVIFRTFWPLIKSILFGYSIPPSQGTPLQATDETTAADEDNPLTDPSSMKLASMKVAQRRALLKKLFWDRKWDQGEIPIDEIKSKQEREYRYLLAPKTVIITSRTGARKSLTSQQGFTLWARRYVAPVNEAVHFEQYDSAERHAKAHPGNQDALQQGAEVIVEAHQTAHRTAIDAKLSRDSAYRRAWVANVRAHQLYNEKHRLDRNALTSYDWSDHQSYLKQKNTDTPWWVISESYALSALIIGVFIAGAIGLIWFLGPAVKSYWTNWQKTLNLAAASYPSALHAGSSAAPQVQAAGGLMFILSLLPDRFWRVLKNADIIPWTPNETKEMNKALEQRDAQPLPPYQSYNKGVTVSLNQDRSEFTVILKTNQESISQKIPLIQGGVLAAEGSRSMGGGYAPFTFPDGKEALSLRPYSGDIWSGIALLSYLNTTSARGLMPKILGVHVVAGEPRLLLEAFPLSGQSGTRQGRLNILNVTHWTELTPAEQAEFEMYFTKKWIDLFKQYGLDAAKNIETDYFFFVNGKLRMGLPVRIDKFWEQVNAGLFHGGSLRSSTDDVNIAAEGDQAPSHAKINPVLQRYHTEKRSSVKELTQNEMDELIQIIRNTGGKDLEELARAIEEGRKDGRFRVYLYGSKKMTTLIPGQTTHAGIRTGAIHIARGEYERLLKSAPSGNKRYAAARIAHEAFEILRWEHDSSLKGQNPDTMRAWIKANLEEAKRMNLINHIQAVGIERRVAKDTTIGDKTPINDPDDVDLSSDSPAFTPTAEDDDHLSPLPVMDPIAYYHAVPLRKEKGNITNVYKGKDPLSGDDVVLKVAISTELSIQDRLINEIVILRKLSGYGEYFPKFLGQGRLADGRLYLLTDYFEGNDLAQEGENLRRNTHNKPSWETLALHIFLETLKAFVILHHHGIYQVDIKPENILIRMENGQIRVRIIDFASSYDTNRHGSGIHYQFSHTPGYIAPEIDLSNPRPTEQTDIYALGVTLYALLTGYSRSESELNVQDHLSKNSEKLGDDLRVVIQDAIVRHPMLRYQSIDEFALAIQQTLYIRENLAMPQEEVSVRTTSPSRVSHSVWGALVIAVGLSMTGLMTVHAQSVDVAASQASATFQEQLRPYRADYLARLTIRLKGEAEEIVKEMRGAKQPVDQKLLKAVESILTQRTRAAADIYALSQWVENGGEMTPQIQDALKAMNKTNADDAKLSQNLIDQMSPRDKRALNAILNRLLKEGLWTVEPTPKQAALPAVVLPLPLWVSLVMLRHQLSQRRRAQVLTELQSSAQAERTAAASPDPVKVDGTILNGMLHADSQEVRQIENTRQSLTQRIFRTNA